MSNVIAVEKEHAVYVRLKSNGQWKRISPESHLVKKKFLGFLWNYTITQYDDLTREEAVEVARKAWDNPDYQDALVLRTNYDREGYYDLCATSVWKNGKWDGRAVNTGSAYCWKNC